MKIPRGWGNGAVEHRPRIAQTSRGDQYGEVRLIKFAYTEDDEQMVTNSAGEQELSSTLVIIDLEEPVNPGDQIRVFLDTDDTRWATVLTRKRYRQRGLPESRELRLR